ncbi:MAG: DNA adenine methylase [Anaerolineales bacterium]|nr:DNA adenine methylase [Anaerolineales bacterium]
MFEYKLFFSNYKLREYEKQLAVCEFENLFPEIKETNITDGKIEFSSYTLLDEYKLKRLTFFSQIIYNNSIYGAKRFVPDQVIFENLKNLNFAELESDLVYQIIPTNGKEIRYLTHSFHEYKGKFYPQLAKSFMNYASLQSHEVVLDPFCGSGTTLVESLLLGANAIGIDINPLAYLLTKCKIRSFFIPIEQLSNVDQYFNEIDDSHYFSDHAEINIPNEEIDIEYLNNWFPDKNLQKIFFILKEIEKLKNKDIQLLLKVTLSNLLREFSYQDPSQLRIRRRKDTPPNNLFKMFVQSLNTHILTLQKFKHLKNFELNTKVENFLGDVRKLNEYYFIDKDSIDLVITSPPYATALPYVDTDRLSLFVFEYTDKDTFRTLEKSLIGNREITKKDRELLDLELEINFTKSILPKAIINKLEKIYNLNKNGSVGFRRKNTAALLFKYFIDMNEAIKQINYVLKTNKYFFMVIGGNRTIAGGEEILIPTDDFLGLIAQKNGFELIKKIRMSVQKSYMIHSKNSINTESILVLKKKQ